MLKKTLNMKELGQIKIQLRPKSTSTIKGKIIKAKRLKGSSSQNS